METITRPKFTSATRIDSSRNVDVFTLAMVMSFPVGEGSLVKAKCWEIFIFMKLQVIYVSITNFVPELDDTWPTNLAL